MALPLAVNVQDFFREDWSVSAETIVEQTGPRLTTQRLCSYAAC